MKMVSYTSLFTLFG